MMVAAESANDRDSGRDNNVIPDLVMVLMVLMVLMVTMVLMVLKIFD